MLRRRGNHPRLTLHKIIRVVRTSFSALHPGAAAATRLSPEAGLDVDDVSSVSDSLLDFHLLLCARYAKNKFRNHTRMPPSHFFSGIFRIIAHILSGCARAALMSYLRKY